MRYGEWPPDWDPVISERRMSERVPDELRILANRYARKARVCEENKVTDKYDRPTAPKWRALAAAARYWLGKVVPKKGAP